MKKVKTCTFDEVQRKKKNVFQMNVLDRAFFQDSEEYEEEKFHIQSGCSHDEDFFKDIEEEVVNKVAYDINDNKKYLVHSGSQDIHKWNKLYHNGHNFKLTTLMKKNIKDVRCIGHDLGCRQYPNSQCPKLTPGGAPDTHHFCCVTQNLSKRIIGISI